ncbi:hypothetical protein QBC35DRAFT_550815 [Podospora australis]|uniref:Uncharacterized protein n=1 Tax=Podospora australis TaxID=1536484 RepID=A0AAN7AJH5_9PEZI|nr:hypothetical protein QBC35DRAFT_550815 [Podospora australis]
MAQIHPQTPKKKTRKVCAGRQSCQASPQRARTRWKPLPISHKRQIHTRRVLSSSAGHIPHLSSIPAWYDAYHHFTAAPQGNLSCKSLVCFHLWDLYGCLARKRPKVLPCIKRPPAVKSWSYTGERPAERLGPLPLWVPDPEWGVFIEGDYLQATELEPITDKTTATASSKAKRSKQPGHFSAQVRTVREEDERASHSGVKIAQSHNKSPTESEDEYWQRLADAALHHTIIIPAQSLFQDDSDI